MLAALGDLVDDIAVTLRTAINVASDTDAVIERRQGGSAANVAVAAARISGRSRLLTRVGDDHAGRALLAQLADDGVDVSHAQVSGHTGSIVVLLDADGERTMLTDPGDSRTLDDPRPTWLDGVAVLHVPLYSLASGTIATTARTVIGWAHQRAIPVSLDASSVALIDSFGAQSVHNLIAELAPAFLFANQDEAQALAIDRSLASVATFVKHGPRPAVVLTSQGRHDVPAQAVEHVADTTGAGDAFAAGVLTALHADPVRAAAAGHAAAAAWLARRTS